MAADALAIDWTIAMGSARRVVGPSRVLCGNVDPTLLYGSRAVIEDEARRCVREAGGRHVFNLGHGVEKDTTEEAVAVLVNAVKHAEIPRGGSSSSSSSSS